MLSDRKDFLETVKVPDENMTSTPSSSFSDRDVYTCLKLMGDTSKVSHFLEAISTQEIDEHKVSTNMSKNYFYSLCAELGNAEYAFRKGKIDINKFNDKINKVCTEHNLDFSYLISITDKITSLERMPDQAESIKLAEEIENMVIEEHEKRTNEGTEN